MADAAEICKVANDHFTKGDFQQALEGYELVLDIHPDKAAINMNIGAALRGLGRHDEALAALEESLKIDESVASAWWNKGLLLEDMDRLDEALEAFDKCLELDPSNAQAVYQRVNVLNIRHRFGEAITAAQAALGTEADTLLLHLELTLACINEHKSDILEKECEYLQSKKDELDSRGNQLLALGYFEIANGLSNSDDRAKAIEFYDKAIEILGSPTMHFNKAVCCMSVNRQGEAEVRGQN